MTSTDACCLKPDPYRQVRTVKLGRISYAAWR